MEEQWLRQSAQKVEEIKKLSPKDRLEYAASCLISTTAIFNSVSRWMQLLSNPALLNDFDKKNLEEIYESYRRFALDFLEFDLKATGKRRPD